VISGKKKYAQMSLTNQKKYQKIEMRQIWTAREYLFKDMDKV